MIVRNKRGSLPVIVLVALTLVLTISTLFIFYLNAGKASAQISSVGFIEGMYVQENLAKYYVYVVGKELIQNNSLTKDNFISEFSKIDFTEDYMIDLKKIISEGKFTLSREHFELDKEVFWLVSADENTVVNYTSRLKVRFKEEDQLFYSNFVEDSSSGILEFKGSGNYEVLSYEECVSGLAQRKIDLEIPEQFCYWEAMTQVYDEKCENLDETDVADIFQKKAEYRQSNNPEWPSLNTDGDFCVSVVYDCDAWAKQSASFMAKGMFVSEEKLIYIRPDITLNKIEIKDVLIHEGLHSIQTEIKKTAYLDSDASWGTASIFSMEEDKVLSAKLISDQLSSLETIKDSFFKKIDSRLVEINGLTIKAEEEFKINLKKKEDQNNLKKKEDQNNDGKFDMSDYKILRNNLTELSNLENNLEDIKNRLELHYDYFSMFFSSSGISFYSDSLKWFQPFLDVEKLIEISSDEKTTLNNFREGLYQSYLIYHRSEAKDYLGRKVEIDPRLSEVQRWWLDKTSPNCEVIYTEENAKKVLDLFLNEKNIGEYWQTQMELTTLIAVYGENERKEEVFNLLIGRLPGLASNTDTGNDGTAVA